MVKSNHQPKQDKKSRMNKRAVSMKFTILIDKSIIDRRRRRNSEVLDKRDSALDSIGHKSYVNQSCSTPIFDPIIRRRRKFQHLKGYIKRPKRTYGYKMQ